MIKREKFYALSESDQQVLLETSERAARAADKLARRDDQRAYESLIKRGMTLVDTSKYKAEWDAAASATRQNLTGRVYSKSLLTAVERVVGGQAPPSKTP